MPNIEVKHLLRENRFSENEVKLIFTIIYLPFGLVLLILRSILVLCLFLLGHVLWKSPVIQKITNKLSCLCFGITVTVEDPKKQEKVDVYISNSLSVFDSLAVHTVTGAISPSSNAITHKLPGIGSKYFGSSQNSDAFKKNIEEVIKEKKMPVYFTPEGTSTNGQGLIKFVSFPFQFSSKVQPICLSIERPFLDISVTSLGSTYLNDVFYFMFSPVTNYKLKFLPPLEKKSLSDAEFAEIVRQNIAEGLKVEPLDISASELKEYEKRKLAEEQQRAQTRQNLSRHTFNSELQRMSMQVKEVLPHVPFNTIYNDLCNTRSVDNTITNILEGRVRFIPEQHSPAQTSSNQPSTSRNINSAGTSTEVKYAQQISTASSSFAKSASERSKSFQERKEQLIAEARRRYIEKHNLNIPS